MSRKAAGVEDAASGNEDPWEYLHEVGRRIAGEDGRGSCEGVAAPRAGPGKSRIPPGPTRGPGPRKTAFCLALLLKSCQSLRSWPTPAPELLRMAAVPPATETLEPVLGTCTGGQVCADERTLGALLEYRSMPEPAVATAAPPPPHRTPLPFISGADGKPRLCRAAPVRGGAPGRLPAGEGGRPLREAALGTLRWLMGNRQFPR
mmetsp:Transcript_130393/g.243958  ORF Transcript_130393/g.243958 Transcript_130393/m.243958 type:complete len:204 (-) Transcript_130393:123-734(-)